MDIYPMITKKRLLKVFLTLISASIIISPYRVISYDQLTDSHDSENQSSYLPLVIDSLFQDGCTQSGLGASIFTEKESGVSSAPYLVELSRSGYLGLAGTPTYDFAAEYFPQLIGWKRAQICNTHDCLRVRAQRAELEGLEYEYLAYGPERSSGVPDEEKYNLPWATEVASQIAAEWNKPLIISYSTKQLHQEAEERGYAWDDPSEVIKLLAPHGDVWMIQAADEYWRLDDGTIRPILSQRVYPPGAEFRAAVEQWVHMIKAANPDIEIWIQLALQRIGVPGENNPDADLLLAYRNSIVDLVDGVYMMPIYGSIEQFATANVEMVKVFEQACVPEFREDITRSKISISDGLIPASSIQDIFLVDEGWTNNVEIPCTPNGDCLTILPDYYYWIFENPNYACGAQGNHQFLVLDHSPDEKIPKNIFAKFLGGAVGFWYEDAKNQRVYYPNQNAVGILRASQNWNMFFRASVSEEYANGVTKRFRENENFRIVIPSYCSHDLYYGRGEYSLLDGFSRWGYLAAMDAIDYVQQYFTSRKIITYGGSAGAAGAFNIGKDQDRVAGIIMDSQAADLSAISEACDDGFNVFGNTYPCYCPEGEATCMQVLAPRIGFNFFADEPYQFVEAGVEKPIYFVWNERDASLYAHLQFENLHQRIELYNPGGESIANMVCITDPRTPPGPICNLHVPSAYDFSVTTSLVNDIYGWAMRQIDLSQFFDIHLPLMMK